MSKFKVLALAATLTMATAGLAIACDKTADAGTASAAGCASGATAQTASAAGCTAASTASAAGCSKNATADHAIKLETVRMPSGSLAVFYHGQNAETVAFLQSSADNGCTGFVCDMAKGMAADENVTTEIATTETGVMILVTSDSAEAVDGYEAQYAAVTASMNDQGE